MKYLIFKIAATQYGFPAHCVQEIKPFIAPIKIPLMPRHVLGITQFRGRIINIVDGRVVNGVVNPDFDNDTSIIVCESNDKLNGIVIDQVIAIIEIDENTSKDTSNSKNKFGLGVKIAQNPELDLIIISEPHDFIG